MAGNGYDDGRGADPRQGWGPASQQHGSGSGAPSAPPAGAFGSYRGEQQPGRAAYDDQGPGGDPYGGSPTGMPEYFGDERQQPAPRPAAWDNPGHTRAFTIEHPYGPPAGPGYAAPGEDHVAVYRAGGRVGPPTGGPRLHWRDLLTGMYLNPSQTFERMRVHQVWLPALTVSLVYGVLAVFGFGDTRSEVLHSTFSVALWTLVGAAVGFIAAGATLGAVTHALARQMGGDGLWQPTVGLSALIAWTTDSPRLLFALFLPADGGFVQVLGWASWLLCAGLMTTMVRRVHDLPWGKAAGAAALQLVALLILIKLPTLS
ncbi:Yip1 family protein [Peterkaempfera griseoplana]|uniref:Yip1 family protein n=1 Tax=Peterkaempfera griseoplana TaxID=66896 RepID=UPI0006E41C93|nr:Yip1 family protein [Peterkaempfera griseoplana]